MSDVRWVGELVLEGHTFFRIGRSTAPDELVAEWVDLCELRSDRSGERSTFVARAGADERLVAKVRSGLAAALLRHLHGETSLHASAVARDGRALAFLGRSGAGKSTLAAWLCRSHGFALLADDVSRLELGSKDVIVEPTEVDHWLDDRSARAVGIPGAAPAEGKSPIEAARRAADGAPLAAMVALALDDAGPPRATVERLRGHRAIEALLPCLVRFVIDEPAAHIAELGRLDELLARVPLYEVRARREYAALPTVAEALETLP